MLALDSVSLLLSKDTPVQAGTTLSVALRELVGIGTLGASKLREPNVTEAQIQGELAVATGWRVMGVNNTVDSVLAAAERLAKEVELETKYWADVLAVSEGGWTVCALPQEKHTLAVRFGFAESASEFSNGSIAPLIRNDDGTIKLGVGKVGGGSQRIRITIKKNGVIVDQSPLPRRLPDDAPLSDRVREARNTIFHQELWYELNREARVLLAHDVYYDGPAIVWKQNKDTSFMFTLEDLDEQDATNTDFSNATRSATAAYYFLQFLLFQSHRQNYHKRTSLAPRLRQIDSANTTYSMLRSLISRFEYYKHSADFGSHLDKLVSTLQHAGLSTSSSAALSPPNSPGSGIIQPRNTPTTELLWVQQLIFNLMSFYVIDITPDVRIWCNCRRVTRPLIGTVFTIALKNPFVDTQDQPLTPLEAVYPPADYFSGVHEAVYYICQATVRVLAQTLARTAAERYPDKDIQWTDTVSGIGIKSNQARNASISIDVIQDNIVLTLKAKWHDGKASRSRTWTWGSDNPNMEGESIDNAVLRYMGGDI